MQRRHSPGLMTAMLALLAAPLASAVVVFAQPVAEPRTPPANMAAAPRPAAIIHVVLISLKDPADAQALIADSDRLIATIPSVISYACGTPLPTERAAVDGDYHVGLYVGFDSADGYTQYLEHDGHTQLVESWKQRTASMRIFDLADPTP